MGSVDRVVFELWSKKCRDWRAYTEGTELVVFPFVRREEVELGVVTSIAIT